MNDLQIEYFLATAQNLSFTKTANERFVSQPAVSKQISALEAELEVKLFELGYKSTKLTVAGQMYFDYFTKHLDELEMIKRKVKENAKSVASTFKICCGSGWTLHGILPDIIKNLKKTHGDIRFLMDNCAFNNISHSVVERQFDVGITLGNDVNKIPTLEVCNLVEVPRVIVYSKDFHLAKKGHLKPEDFKDEWFIVPQSHRMVYINNLVNSFCEPYGFTPEIQTVRNSESLINSVINGLGVAIVDYWTYQTIEKECDCVLLNTSHTISAVWLKKNNNPIINDFIEELKKSLINIKQA